MSLKNMSMKCSCAVNELLENGCTCGAYKQYPGKETVMEAYTKIGKLASDHGLIVSASGGVILIATPDNQRTQGVFLKCLYMAGFGPHPQSFEGTDG